MEAKKRGRSPSRDASLTTADLVVLSLLAERPMHGYDLLAEYKRQEVADWASISKAQLYYALKKLDSLGLIRGRADKAAARDRTVYSPTSTGLIALDRELANQAWAQGRVAQPFLTWYGLSIHTSAASRRDVLQQRMHYLEAEIEKERNSLAYIDHLTEPRAVKGGDIVRLTIELLEVERRWLAALVARGSV